MMEMMLMMVMMMMLEEMMMMMIIIIMMMRAMRMRRTSLWMEVRESLLLRVVILSDVGVTFLVYR